MRAEARKLPLKLIPVQSIAETPSIGQQRYRNLFVIERPGRGVGVDIDDGRHKLPLGGDRRQHLGGFFAKMAAAARVEVDSYHRRSCRQRYFGFGRRR